MGPRAGRRSASTPPPRIAALELVTSDVRARVDGRSVGRRRARGRLAARARSARSRPIVVHLNGYVHAALPWRAPASWSAHSCVLSWGEAVRRRDRRRARSRAYRVAVAPGSARAPTRRRADAVDARTRSSATTARCAQRRWSPTAGTRSGSDRRSQGAVRVQRRPPVGSREERRGASMAVAPRLPWPVIVAGRRTPAAGGPARARTRAGCSRSADRDMARARVDLRAAGALRAVRPARRSRPRWPAARSCSATSAACARSGATPPLSCDPDDHDALRARPRRAHRVAATAAQRGRRRAPARARPTRPSGWRAAT